MEKKDIFGWIIQKTFPHISNLIFIKAIRLIPQAKNQQNSHRLSGLVVQNAPRRADHFLPVYLSLRFSFFMCLIPL